MSVNIKLLILISFIYYINTMNLDDQVLFDREKNYIGLPNELPTLSGMGIVSDDGQKENKTSFTSIREKIYNLKNLIGALPIPEQIALLESMDSSYFNETKINEIITKRKLYEKEYINFLNYLEDYEKQLPYGLGCLQFTANRLVYNSKYNEDMNSILYNNIDEIITTHRGMIQEKKNLLDTIFPILLQNRQKLYKISSTPKCDEEEYICDENNITTGITFSSTQQKQIVDAFIKNGYLQGQLEKAAKLANLVMLSEIAISNMDGCRNFKDPNDKAGESSTYIKNEKITYHRRNKKQKGINADKRIGIENRTSNGYKIYEGYFTGGSRRHDNGTYINSYIPRELNSEFTKVIEIFSTSYSSTDERITFINNFTSNLNVNNANSNIENLDQIFSNETISNQVELKYLTNISNFIKHKCPSNYFVYCKEGSCKFNNFKSESDLSTINDTNLTLIVCLKNEYPLGIQTDNSTNYTNLGGFGSSEKINYMLKMANQGCFGVFTSGGKNDKDACRDVLKDKCGTELDYQCKKLGLYDYINSNPAADTIPEPCKNYNSNSSNTTALTQCFQWINTNFITSGLSLKASALIGTNLLLQKKISSSVFSTTLKNGSNVDEVNITLPDYSNQNYTFFSNYSDAFKYTFKYYMNKGNHFIMENAGKYLSMKIMFFFGISFLLL